ncbi:MAG TPA: hypothetical protein VE422_15655 [Terriglobia bacterium]|nr:hypothetical protein [Terriglobia bacterium]
MFARIDPHEVRKRIKSDFSNTRQGSDLDDFTETGFDDFSAASTISQMLRQLSWRIGAFIGGNADKLSRFGNFSRASTISARIRRLFTSIDDFTRGLSFCKRI